MRIGVDIRGLLTGKISGVEQYMAQILRHLLEIDKTNTYVLFYVSYKDHDKNFVELTERYPYLKQANVEVKTLKWPDAPLLLHAAFKPLNWPKADIVCGGLDVMFMPFPSLLPLSKKCAKVTFFHDLIFMIHPEFFTKTSRVWQWQMSYGYEARTSDIALAASECTKQDMIRLTPVEPGRARVVYEGVAKEYFDDHSHLLSQTLEKYKLPTRYIYFVGSLEPRKNLTTLIRALSDLKANSSDTIKLVISGQKSWLFEGVREVIAQLKLEEDIFFTGYVTEEEKITLMQGAQVFVHPGVYEGFGLMVLEAFATQTPVVVADNSSLSEVAADAGLKVETFDHKAMAQAIQRLLTDESLRKELTTRGLQRAKTFSWETAATTTLGYLKQAVEIHGK